MAGNSKEQQLSLHVYSSLRRLSCPSVDGLYLREADSMQELLCTPSLHRMDILKWICARICPSLREKFSTIKSSETEEVAKEITRFGHEMLLCKADDQELIKGFATPLRQLLFLEQLLMIAAQQDTSPDESSGGGNMANEDLLKELMSPDHLTDLIQLMNPVCNPWSVHIQEYLKATQATRNKANHKKTNECHHESGCDKLGIDNIAEATALLQSTRHTLEELRKECEFLQLEQSGPAASLSPCALKVAVSDMAQLMTAFSQVYSTDFRGYCQRAPPALNPNACVFQSVHQLLHHCNMELEVLQQLSKTSSTLTEIVKQIQTDKRFWANGEKLALRPERKGPLAPGHEPLCH
ncbi:HAUS augmin-like complex subunit 7 isoform X2 [Neoarius graeffei]|uniref:HAUS augmin-like complex subunit 7 isoform X2 n=1 Tax=Neoarius graeffei TaxID=443677 RepID=UPI00298CD713|nr:HAUS augmin-like complex subunit 7 isoform X2 [Neoarius graeffei]